MTLKITKLNAFTLNDVVVARDNLRNKLISGVIKQDEQEDLQALEGICSIGDLITSNEFSKHGLIIRGLLQEPMTQAEQDEFQSMFGMWCRFGR